jgi:uncharacterized protein YdhG (YjbR/CyaY superfamily)
VRAVIKAAAPGATERISYGIPTFDLNGKYLVYFAGWKKHISVYPVPGGDAAFEAALGPTSKGDVRFPLDQPLPADLIRRIVGFRVAEVTPRLRKGLAESAPNVGRTTQGICSLVVLCESCRIISTWAVLDRCR